MQQTDGVLTFSPSDLNHFVECPHLTSLDLLAATGGGVAKTVDPHAEIIRAKGLEHERAWLDRLKREGREIRQIAAEQGIDWVREASRTLDAMREGVEVIYQGVFFDASWRGIADFLVRVDEPSAIGPWSYEAWDTKLARHPKPYFVLQLCWYTEQLARIQGRMPHRMHLVLGTGEAVAYPPHDFLAYYRAVRDRFLKAVETGAKTYPLPVGHCHVCGYADHCDRQRRLDDHLSLVAGIRRDQVERLEAAGVARVAQLAVAGPESSVGITPQTFDRLVRQARLQNEFRFLGRHRYELIAPEPRRGFGLLPVPSDGDVFFDIEGYPYFELSRGLEYMWGVSVREGDRWVFRSFEADDRESEKLAFEQFIDFVHRRLDRYPDLHVYHYAPYETSAIKRLMGEYATREAEVDDLLRREVFVDLYQVVRQSMCISHDGYSLKKVRQFFMTAAEGAVRDGGESILEFQRFLETGAASILDGIREYNTEDCESTRLLRDWLLERRDEARNQFGVEIAWATRSGASEESPEERDDNSERRARLGEVEEGDALLDPQRATGAGLLKGLVDYHARESKPGWWAFFDRLKKSLDELREDADAISFLTPVASSPPVAEKKSLVYTLSFPDQEFKLREGAEVREPTEGRSAGDLVSVSLAGTLALRRGPSLVDVPLPKALIAAGPVPTKAQRSSLIRIADRLLSGEDERTASRALLARELPRVLGRQPGSNLQSMDLAEQQAVVESLDRSGLFVQGPPGSGKTYTGARLIVHLVGRGQRVAVTATSHKAIHNLLDEVVVAGREMGVAIAGIKKSSGKGESEYRGAGFVSVESNRQCEESDVPVVAGTSWLFSRGEMEGRFDYLFIDEAGQVSLADTVAMSPCARNVVLLGDPQQLPHVTQGVHPPGAAVSVLEHLLAGELTVGPRQGLFLEQTWRMHPDVCRFVSELAYEGRLRAHPHCARQTVHASRLAGTGLRYLSVEHSGNAQQSREETGAIATEIRALLDGGLFTDRHGVTRPLGVEDILVVAPYNMQVHLLMDALPKGVEVGTVDKFQGREAPVVFFSLATSSGDDIPRGLEFLFSRHRLNVAVSRAMAMAVLVCSPRLLEARCRTVEQMRLTNALCAFVDRALT